jgi:AAA domain
MDNETEIEDIPGAFRFKYQAKQANTAKHHVSLDAVVVPIKPIVTPPQVTTFAELKPEPRTYLWPPYIPDNGYCIDGGRGGSGKTTIGIALCAWASIGKFPGMDPSEPRRALIIELQDGDANEIKPKLHANGYDERMVLRLENKKPPTLEELNALIVAHKPGIIMISPLNRFVSNHVKSLNDDKEVEPLLDALNRIGEHNRCLILGVKHLNKKPDLSDGDRIGNAGAFVNSARTGFIMAYDRQNDVRLMEIFKASRGDYKTWRVRFTDVGHGASPTNLTAYVKVTMENCEQGDTVETLLRSRPPLSEERQEVIDFFASRDGEFSYKEVAKELGRKEATVKTQLNRMVKSNQIRRGFIEGTFAAKAR